jgi:hypothetical protein
VWQRMVRVFPFEPPDPAEAGLSDAALLGVLREPRPGDVTWTTPNGTPTTTHAADYRPPGADSDAGAGSDSDPAPD